MVDRVTAIFATHLPDWADVQVSLNFLRTKMKGGELYIGLVKRLTISPKSRPTGPQPSGTSPLTEPNGTRRAETSLPRASPKGTLEGLPNRART